MERSVLHLFLCAAVLFSACGPQNVSPTGVAASPSPSPTPNTLPRSDEQLVMARALESQGARVTRVLPSKFDWLFGGAAPRSGTFEVTFDGQQTWADVHFFDRKIGTIIACSGQPNTSKARTFSVAVDGRLESLNAEVTGELSSGSMSFAANDRYFVMTPDPRLRNALRAALSLAVPGCREPVSLPLLAWEREVTDALTTAGLEVQLVGGSKWESFLGTRREARVFIWRRGDASGGADVLFLSSPLGVVRGCSAPLPNGFTRTTITVDGKPFTAEGSQNMLPLAGDRFFVIAWDATTVAALRRPLALATPAC